MAARLVTQKGIDIILDGPDLLTLGAQFAFLGSGEPRFERALQYLAGAFAGRIAVNTGFTDELEHQLMGGADFLLMPCQYEPCGLTQMRAQRYGALPVVRRVGGLADTVEDGQTGFVFDEYKAEPLVGAALRAIDAWSVPSERNRLMGEAMIATSAGNARSSAISRCIAGCCPANSALPPRWISFSRCTAISRGCCTTGAGPMAAIGCARPRSTPTSR
jgi:starch synthase